MLLWFLCVYYTKIFGFYKLLVMDSQLIGKSIYVVKIEEPVYILW